MRSSLQNFFLMKVLIFSTLSFVVEAAEPCKPITAALKTGWLKVKTSLPNSNPIQTQTQLAVKTALTYPFHVPGKIYNRSRHALGMGDYQLLEANPAGFNVLKKNGSRNSPNVLSSLPWVSNRSKYAEVLEVDVGLCMGQTTAQRKLNVLSFFDPQNTALQNVPDKTKDLEAWYKFFENKITSLLKKNEPTIFPGFQNIQSLATEPRFEKLIKKHITELWAEKNISLGGLGVLNSTKNMPTIEKANDLHKLVSDRLNKNFSPLLYLAEHKPTGSKESYWIHVMQAFKVDPIAEDGSYLIHVWDVNYSPFSASKTIQVDAKGGMKYGEIILGEVNQVPWDNHEMGEMTVNLLKFCEKNPSLCQPK